MKAFVRYLGGRRVHFGAEAFGLDETCDELGYTDLERALAHALADVKWGERVSYGELAARAGRPRAPRAAGAFCAGCPLDLFLPAHRVVRSDGSLGEYGSHGRALQAAPARSRGARVSPRRQLRIVCLGGGTGLSTLLRGIKLTGAQVTAIVTLTDDGGSSGRLRRDLAMPPPGDIRNCLIALAEDESLMNRLFRHRFDRGELAGHAFGNIFLAALTEVVGSFDAAVAEVGRVLAVEGSVVPATTHPAALLAEMDDGRFVAGETAVAGDRHGVRRLFLSPADAVANPQALAAVERADLIVLGPGSLFTSTLPPLLVPGSGAPCCTRAGCASTSATCSSSRARRSATRPRITSSACTSTSARASIDSVMIPRRAIVTEKIPVEFDRARLAELGVRVVAAQIVAPDGFHHDPEALARALVRAAQRRVRNGRAVR